MSRGFQKGNKFGTQPAPKGSPRAKVAAFDEPFTAEQTQYVNQLLEFQNIDHWFPYTASELPPGFTHLATIAKVMMISAKRHQSIMESHPSLSHGNGQRLLHHLCRLGFSHISEKNIEQRSVGGKKVQWVNFHASPTLCPMEILLQENTRILAWSRKINLKVGCLAKNEEKVETDEEVRVETEGRMWSAAADKSGGSAGTTAASCVGCASCAGSGGGGVSSSSCSSPCSGCSRVEERKGMIAGCLSLLNDMKYDAAAVRDWLMHQRVIEATATLDRFVEFEALRGQDQVSFLLASGDGDTTTLGKAAHDAQQGKMGQHEHVGALFHNMMMEVNGALTFAGIEAPNLAVRAADLKARVEAAAATASAATAAGAVATPLTPHLRQAEEPDEDDEGGGGEDDREDDMASLANSLEMRLRAATTMKPLPPLSC